MNKTITLVLQGRFSADGNLISHGNTKRIVSVDMDKEDEVSDIRQFLNKEDGQVHWGIVAENSGFWMIYDAFEWIEPTTELHENKYPVAYHLTEEQFSEIFEKSLKK